MPNAASKKREQIAFVQRIKIGEWLVGEGPVGITRQNVCDLRPSAFPATQGINRATTKMRSISGTWRTIKRGAWR